MPDLPESAGVSYRAGSLLASARTAYQRSDGNSQQWQLVILLAALGLEAYLNELSDQLRRWTRNAEPAFLAALGNLLKVAEAENTSLRLRFQLVYFGLTQTSINRGSLPYQDLDLLIDIRNRIVHTKPTPVAFDVAPNDQDKLVLRLAARQVIARPPDGAAKNWPQYVLTRSVAAWAYNTALANLRFIFEAVPDSNLKEQLVMLWAAHEPLDPDGSG